MFRLEVVVRNVDEIAQLTGEIESLKAQLVKKEQEIHRIGLYASLSIGYIDQLKRCKAVLDRAGLDSSFIKLR